MIDPKTLKRGDVVLLGGSNALQLTVSEVNSGYIWFGDKEAIWKGSCIWQIAELKKPEVPDRIEFLGVEFASNWSAAFGRYTFSPSNALSAAKKIVAQLEAAGVKEAF